MTKTAAKMVATERVLREETEALARKAQEAVAANGAYIERLETTLRELIEVFCGLSCPRSYAPIGCGVDFGEDVKVHHVHACRKARATLEGGSA